MSCLASINYLQKDLYHILSEYNKHIWFVKEFVRIYSRTMLIRIKITSFVNHPRFSALLVLLVWCPDCGTDVDLRKYLVRRNDLGIVDFFSYRQLLLMNPFFILKLLFLSSTLFCSKVSQTSSFWYYGTYFLSVLSSQVQVKL